LSLPWRLRRRHLQVHAPDDAHARWHKRMSTYSIHVDPLFGSDVSCSSTAMACLPEVAEERL
jgi:hypothetical protein